LAAHNNFRQFLKAVSYPAFNLVSNPCLNLIDPKCRRSQGRPSGITRRSKSGCDSRWTIGEINEASQRPTLDATPQAVESWNHRLPWAPFDSALPRA
jgi:hypothetical protein